MAAAVAGSGGLDISTMWSVARVSVQHPQRYHCAPAADRL